MSEGTVGLPKPHSGDLIESARVFYFRDALASDQFDELIPLQCREEVHVVDVKIEGIVEELRYYVAPFYYDGDEHIEYPRNVVVIDCESDDMELRKYIAFKVQDALIWEELRRLTSEELLWDDLEYVSQKTYIRLLRFMKRWDMDIAWGDFDVRDVNFLPSEIDLKRFLASKCEDYDDALLALFCANLDLILVKLDYILISNRSIKFDSDDRAIDRYLLSDDFDPGKLKSFYVLTYIRRHISEFGEIINELSDNCWCDLEDMWYELMSKDEGGDVVGILDKAMMSINTELVFNANLSADLKARVLGLLRWVDAMIAVARIPRAR